ncbi:MAG: hypothetical protein QOJ00_2626 [Actinomycetota bacterium]|jgi:hypothetical protein
MSLLMRNRRAAADLKNARSAVEEAAVALRACVPIASVVWRQPVRVQGRVRSMRVQPWADVASLECTLVDESGGITVVFLGRRKIAGIHPGTVMCVEGVSGSHRGKLAMMNPVYELIETPHVEVPHH